MRQTQLTSMTGQNVSILTAKVTTDLANEKSVEAVDKSDISRIDQ